MGPSCNGYPCRFLTYKLFLAHTVKIPRNACLRGRSLVPSPPSPLLACVWRALLYSGCDVRAISDPRETIYVNLEAAEASRKNNTSAALRKPRYEIGNDDMLSCFSAYSCGVRGRWNSLLGLDLLLFSKRINVRTVP
jgi:hypothetical protein